MIEGEIFSIGVVRQSAQQASEPTSFSGKSPAAGFNGWNLKLYSGFLISTIWPPELGVTTCTVSVCNGEGSTLSPACSGAAQSQYGRRKSWAAAM